MENITVTTMPIKPYEKINIGLMIAPTLVDIIGSLQNVKRYYLLIYYIHLITKYLY